MPSIAIALNGMRLATIDLTGLDMAHVAFDGALDKPQKAWLHASGGRYAASASSHLIWLAGHAVGPGEVFTVTLRNACDIADRGKTIAELYPDDEPCTVTDFSITDEMAAEIRARPRLHDHFIVQAETSSGRQANAASNDRNTDFSFSVVWHHDDPSQARVRLATYCFDDVLKRTGGNEHLQTMIGLEDSASFVLVG